MMSKLAEVKEYAAMCAKTGFKYHNAVQDVNYLLSIIEEKDKALDFYADESNYDQNEGAFNPEIIDERGELARTALKSTKEE
jgi:hypothetical protein